MYVYMCVICTYYVYVCHLYLFSSKSCIIKRHKIWHAVEEKRLGKCLIIIVVITKIMIR